MMAEPVNYYEPTAAIVDDRECPACGETIDLKETVCPHCQADVAALDKKVKGKIPRGIKVLAYLYFVIAAFMCFGLFGIFAAMRVNPLLMSLSAANSVCMIALIIAQAVSYLKAYQWAWWYTVSNCLIIIISTIYGMIAMQLNALDLPAQVPMGMLTGIQVATLAVGLIILMTFMWKDAKEYFRTEHANWKTILLAIVVVFVFQFVVFSLPTMAVTYFMGPEALMLKLPDQAGPFE